MVIVDNVTAVVNYGLNRVRFPRAGSGRLLMSDRAQDRLAEVVARA